jgi:uncharacterized repeat protein (TIGR01451 family)
VLAGKFPDLALVKEDHVPSVLPGQVFFYQLTYENNGALAPNVVVFDTIPVGTTFNAPGSTPGWSCAHGAPAGTVCEIDIPDLPPLDPGDAVVISLRVDSALPAGFDLIENTGEIRWFLDEGPPGHEDNLDDNVSTHTTPVDVSGIAPDLVIGKDDGGISAAPGDTVSYQLTYANAGTRGATGVEIADTVPVFSTFDAGASSAGWTCAHGAPAGTECRFALGTLQPGDGAAIVFAVRVDPVLPPGAQQLDNSASITDDGANGPDLDPSDNLAADTTPFGGPGAGPDLAVSKSDGGVTASPGDLVTYQIGYANLGPRGSTGVELTEMVPEHSTFEPGASTPGWSCTGVAPAAARLKPERVQHSVAGVSCTLPIGTLVSGDGGSAAFAVRVADPVPGGVAEIANVVSITDDGTNGPDVDPGNNSSTDTTPIDSGPGPGPGTGLDATAIDTALAGLPAEPGDDVAYTVVITNDGDEIAQEVELEASPPEHTTLSAGTVTTTAGDVAQGNDPGDTSVLVVVGELAAGEEAVVTFEVAIDSPLPAGVDEIAFQGTVRAAGDLTLLTDDPDTPAPDDPTRTPVAQGSSPTPAEIPTAGTLGLLALVALLGLAAILRLRTAAIRPSGDLR